MPPASSALKTADVVDKLVKEIDPEVILAGVLGGVAAVGGLTPPLTRILITIGGSEAGMDIKDLVAGGTYNPVGLGPGLLSPILAAIEGSQSDNESTIKQSALFASGMLEAMMMYSFAKNPGTPEMLAALISKIPTPSIVPL